MKGRCQKAAFMELGQCLHLPSDAGEGSFTHKHRGSAGRNGVCWVGGAPSEGPASGSAFQKRAPSALSVVPTSCAPHWSIPGMWAWAGVAVFMEGWKDSTCWCGEELMAITGRSRSSASSPRPFSVECEITGTDALGTVWLAVFETLIFYLRCLQGLWFSSFSLPFTQAVSSMLLSTGLVCGGRTGVAARRPAPPPPPPPPPVSAHRGQGSVEECRLESAE